MYTISYELDDGTNNADNPNSYTIETETITLKAPTKAGYEFLGWTYEGEMITEIANGSTGDKTITATWEKVTQTQSPDTSTIPGASERISISAEEISQMKEEELQKTFENKTDIVLTGKVENLLLILEKIEKVTTVKNLDLSLAKELTEVKLDDSHSIETLTIAGNKSIKTIEVNGCKTLKELNIEGCESLEYLDVSETSITYLNAQDCENLGTVYCASCDIEELNLEGCENLKTLDCRNNRLLMLNASVFENLSSLECSHQRAVKPLAKLINFVDLLFGRGKFATSATNEDSTYLKNVKNLKAYDEAGHALLKVKDSENGEVEFSGEPAKITYDYDTGFEDTMMDVEISVFESENELVGSSNGGCTFGFGTWALAVLMLLLIPILKMKTAKY